MVPRSPRRSALAVVIPAGVVGVLALVAAAVRPPWEVDPDSRFIGRTPGVPPSVALPTMPTAPDGGAAGMPTVAVDPLTWVPWVLGVAALVVAALVVLALRRHLHRRDRRPSEVPVTEEFPAAAVADVPTLLRGAVSADERLVAIGDPTEAIVAAWLALEDAAADSGTPRPPSATPTEFTAAVLAGTGAPEAPVRRLLALYLRVRFGSRPATEADLDVARRCVRELAEHWSAYASHDPANRPAAVPGAAG